MENQIFPFELSSGNQNRIDTELLTLNKKYLVSLFRVHVS